MSVKKFAQARDPLYRSTPRGHDVTACSAEIIRKVAAGSGWIKSKCGQEKYREEIGENSLVLNTEKGKKL